MEKAIARISRENHLSHLTKTLPFISIVFVIQCLLIKHFSPTINLGDYALYLASGLVLFVVSMVYYDNNHHVIIYPDHLLVYFGLMGTNRKVYYNDIEKVVGPEQECHFSTIVLKLKDKEHMSFYFVDYPMQVKALIDVQMQGLNLETDTDQAA